MEEKYMQMLIEAAQSAKSAHHRIDKIEGEVSEIKELTVAVKEIAMETKATREDINSLNSKVKEDVGSLSSRLKDVEDKPAKNWEKLVSIIITRDKHSCPGLFFS